MGTGECPEGNNRRSINADFAGEQKKNTSSNNSKLRDQGLADDWQIVKKDEVMAGKILPNSSVRLVRRGAKPWRAPPRRSMDRRQHVRRLAFYLSGLRDVFTAARLQIGLKLRPLLLGHFRAVARRRPVEDRRAAGQQGAGANGERRSQRAAS